ncbi:MAG: hypothetical protein COX77_01645 [Candidatus Komeilibacteria bacterium CG_4_10_14_0_2_um_filter_37_10]|uniref:Pseudouridine synthase n=1 Tax=Candidatus Komeilibacteria bacterium CG_4_10_14_0_2_um_filter_37_10 TaxID=1974470 RepID=A0A2M7VFK6_9BACT|nr:MAG: hypothetical protein COX77_01645 [Candidatus Komeilibacteria bacterium CG_4_10_14_0_2_um_filter_37_10]PJA93794.1 MAG: hypothetical protein CO133_00955 [Candidatus Komeilibacteria bacterium CG_4_9_14_3_um_filter_37_5]
MNSVKTFQYLKDERMRLDVFLLAELNNLSRAAIQKNIISGNVWVNEKTIKINHFFLKNGDRVEWQEPKITQLSTIQVDNAILALPNINIIDQIDNYVVIEKPTALLAHATANKPNQPSLIDWLLKNFPQARQIGEDPLRPALVHRLDKDVSGLMVIPLNQNYYDHLKQQFKLRKVDKEYLGLVHGQFSAPSGEIDLPITRSKNTGKMAARSHQQGGKKSLTSYQVIKQYRNYALLSISLHSGRTNQIRVHFSALGRSLAGDKLYQNKNITIKNNLSRVFLHAHKVAWPDLDGKIISYESPLPKELANFLTKLK